MTAAICLAQVQACATRVTLLDTNGVPHPGAQAMVTTKGLTKLTIKGVYSDGDEFKEKNACGEVLLSYRAPDTFERIDVDLEFLYHDPYLFALMANATVLTDGDAIGSAAPNLGSVEERLVSVEVWARRINMNVPDPDYPYAWWVLPMIKNVRFGDRTFENAPAKPTLSGQGYENDNWYNGPLNDWPAASSQVWQWIPTDVLPTATCGYQTVGAS